MRLLCLLGMVMMGCGGNEPAPAPDAPRPKKSAKDTRPVIVAFGDSLTDGFGVPEGQKYTDYLQQALDEKGYKYRVVNAGVSGDTSNNALDRVQGVLNQDPKVVILEIGGNDGLRGLGVEGTRSNLKEMIAKFQKMGVKVVLWGMTLPPSYGPDYVRSFERMYAELARELRVPMIPLREEIARFAGNEKLMQPDRIHPTGEGYRALAPVILDYLEPLLQR